MIPVGLRGFKKIKLVIKNSFLCMKYQEKSKRETQEVEGAGGRKNGELAFEGYRVSLQKDEKVLEMIGGVAHTAL